MRTFLLLLALVPLLAGAEPPIPPPLVERLKQATIPSLQLDQATIHEALAKLKSEWIRQHPGESFPIVLIETQSYGNPRITLDLQNVPFWAAVRALGDSTGLNVHDDGKTIRIDMEPKEDFNTKVFMLNEDVVRTLGLTANGNYQSANAALARFGLIFKDPCLAALSPDGTSLTVRQTPDQMSLIPGILHLLAKGFSVKPPPTAPPK
jgi:hypothetical protein